MILPFFLLELSTSNYVWGQLEEFDIITISVLNHKFGNVVTFDSTRKNGNLKLLSNTKNLSRSGNALEVTSRKNKIFLVESKFSFNGPVFKRSFPDYWSKILNDRIIDNSKLSIKSGNVTFPVFDFNKISDTTEFDIVIVIIEDKDTMIIFLKGMKHPICCRHYLIDSIPFEQGKFVLNIYAIFKEKYNEYFNFYDDATFELKPNINYPPELRKFIQISPADWSRYKLTTESNPTLNIFH